MRWAIIGYYGLGNFGDDLMLYLLVEQIVAFDRSARFLVVMARNGSERYVQLPEGCKATCIRIDQKWKLLAAVSNSDIVLIGGGTSLHRRGFAGFPFTLIARLLGKKVYAVSMGVDEVGRGITRLKAKFALKAFHAILVRDQPSADLARAINPATRVILAADLAYLVSDSGVGIRPRDNGDTPRTLLVAWRDFSEYYSEQEQKLIIQNAATAIAAASHTISIDRVAVVNLADLVDDKITHVFAATLRDVFAQRGMAYEVSVHNDLSLREKLRLIREAHFCISARLHGYLICKLAGQRGIGVAYATKVENFAASLNVPNVVHPINLLKSGETLESAILGEHITPSRPIDVPAYTARARTNVSFLKDLNRT